MAERNGDHAAIVTEPIVIPVQYVDGITVEATDSVIRLVGWVDLVRIDGEDSERRIVMRIAMSSEIARSLYAALKKLFGRGGH
jgi:hypothetical protein